MRRALIVLLLTALPAVAFADFHEVVQAVERATGIRHTYIPFLGVARFFVRIIEPEGLSDLRIAFFEGKRRSPRGNFDEAIRAAIGPEWQPVVRAVSKRDGERALIFAKPTRGGMRVIVVAHEPGEAIVAELQVDLDRFADFVGRAHDGDPFRW